MEKRHLFYEPEKEENKPEFTTKSPLVFFSSSSYINVEPVENEELTNRSFKSNKKTAVVTNLWQMPSEYFL